VELDGVEFSGKITPPASASVLELVGHGNLNHIPTLFSTKVDGSSMVPFLPLAHFS
jgi:hypothetical protein